ncbi:hypothetical protein [Paracoccus contaminans]|nr:hypothetical protein [Paracoccus contaminans]
MATADGRTSGASGTPAGAPPVSRNGKGVGSGGGDLDALAAQAGAAIARLIGSAEPYPAEGAAGAPGPAPSPQGGETRLGQVMAVLFDRLAATRPDMVPAMPRAIAQGARLALSAEHPATRAMMEDFTREAVAEAIQIAGMDASTHPVLASWDQADPVLRRDGALELTARDEAAFARLAKRAGYRPTLKPAAFWDATEEASQDRVQPARMNAWAAGAEAAWDRLNPSQRRLAASVLDVEAMPPAALIRAVTGTEDLPGWLGGIAIPLTKAEAAANPELARFLRKGAFAGPLAELLTARSMAGSAAPGAPGLTGGATQLQRLNNWSAMTGEMHSWESYRYSTQGW